MKNHVFKHCFAVLLMAFCISALCGCGYTFRRSFDADSVSVSRIENLTPEPALGDRFEEALTLSLMRNGIKVRADAPYAIIGTIEDLRLRGLSEKDGVTVTYEVTVKGSFFLSGGQGEAKRLRSGNVFIVTFSSDESLEKTIALKDEAIERALADMTEQIAASIIYGR